MFRIEVKEKFDAKHALRLYDGSFEPSHSHQWVVAATIQAQRLDRIGVVVDFSVVRHNLKEILSEYQKKSFNDHPDFKAEGANPSAENIAKVIFDKLSEKINLTGRNVTNVTVWETPEASGSYFL